MMKIQTTCPLCGKKNLVEVEAEDYEKYKAGGLIQSCFPYLEADQRELLITGICPECFEKAFEEE